MALDGSAEKFRSEVAVASLSTGVIKGLELGFKRCLFLGGDRDNVVVGVEVMDRADEWDDRVECVLFELRGGDRAVATVDTPMVGVCARYPKFVGVSARGGGGSGPILATAVSLTGG